MTKKNTMNNIAIALIDGNTIHRNKSALVNGEKVGADTYIEWNKAMNECHRTFYAFQKHMNDVAQGVELDTRVENYAFDAMRKVIDLIGEVNGFKVTVSADLMKSLSGYAIAEKKTLIGDALEVDSIVKSYRAQKKAMCNDDGQKLNGINDELWEEVISNLADAEEELKELKKQSNSAKKVLVRAKYDNFKYGLETTLAKLVARQSMKTWEELEEEEKARKEARKAAKKARKAAQAK